MLALINVLGASSGSTSAPPELVKTGSTESLIRSSQCVLKAVPP